MGHTKLGQFLKTKDFKRASNREADVWRWSLCGGIFWLLSVARVHVRQTICLEGNLYFPRNSIVPDVLEDSWVRTLCCWKGRRPLPLRPRRGPPVTELRLVLPAARMMKGHIAFAPGGGVIVSETIPDRVSARR